MTFLEDRTPRERALVFGALALAAIFLIWQFVLAPVFAGKAAAQQDLRIAQRDFEIVKLGLPNMKQQTKVDKAVFDRSAAVETAKAVGLTISRIQPGQNESLQVWFEDAQSSSVYAFLGRISAAYNVDISRAQISRQESGFVSAQLTLAPL